MNSNVLLVENSSVDAEKIKAVLAAEGYSVLHVGSGGEATNQIGVAEPWLVLVTQALPDMSCVHFLNVLEEAPDQAPLRVSILMLALGGDRNFTAVKHPPSMYLTKPFTPQELVMFVRRLRGSVGATAADK